jgi:hypothetical protein
MTGFSFTPLNIAAVGSRRRPSPDVTAPTFLSATTQSGGDGAPMRMTITNNEPTTLTLGGTDAALLQIASNVYATSHVIELSGDANLNAAVKSSYSFTIVARDTSSNATSATAHTFNVANVLDVVLHLGDSNTGPARNTLAEMPPDFYSTDANAFIYDAQFSNSIKVLRAPTYSTVTISVASPGVITWNANGLLAGDMVTFTTTGALPTGFAINTIYYVVSPATNTFSLAATSGGSAINTTGTQSGTHTCFANNTLQCQSDFYAGPVTSWMQTAGGLCEFTKQYRIDNPTKKICYVLVTKGGSEFSDSGSQARAGNWTVTLTDGTYVSFKGFWSAFLTKAAAAGYTVNLVGIRISGPANGARDLTQSNAFGAAQAALINAIQTDISSTARIVVERLSTNQTAFSTTNVNIIRAAELANARADPTLRRITNTDGLICTDSEQGLPPLHWSAASNAISNEMLHHEIYDKWYPFHEWADNGGNPCTHQWRFGDIRNNSPFTPAPGSTQQFAFDLGSTLGTQQTTSSKRPTISSSALANGYPTARFATGDGVDDILVSATPVTMPFAYNGDWSFYAALSAPATANKVFFGMGGSSTIPLFYFISHTDGGGGLMLGHRSDGNVPTTVDFSVGGSAIIPFNNVMNFIHVWKVGNTITAQVNGTVGAPQTFAPATTTLNRFAFFGVSGGGTEIFQMNAKMWGIHIAGPSDATYRANARAFYQRHAGTV